MPEFTLFKVEKGDTITAFKLTDSASQATHSFFQDHLSEPKNMKLDQNRNLMSDFSNFLKVLCCILG